MQKYNKSAIFKIHRHIFSQFYKKDTKKIKYSSLFAFNLRLCYFCTAMKKMKNILQQIKRKRIFTCAGIAATVFLSLWAYSCKEKAKADELPPCAVSAPLDSVMASLFTSDDEPGGILIVIKNDSLVYRRAIGLADLQTREHIGMNTRFNGASISKIFAATALLRLEETGKIELDDSLSKYFPELGNDFFGQITIRNILTHSSGLPDLRPIHPDEWKKYTKDNTSVFGSSEDYRLFGTENEHMKCFRRIKELEFETGSHYRKDDPAYVLVAPLIEKVTGVFFDKWMQDNIFTPANVEGMCYYNPGEQLPKVAHGYRIAAPNTHTKAFISKDGKWEEFDYGEAPFFISKADKGVNLTATEFINWKRAYYNHKVISEQSFKTIFYPYIVTDIPYVSFGLGCAFRQEPGDPVSEYHMAQNGGYTALDCSWPDKRLHYALLSNRNDWDYVSVAASIRAILRKANFLDEE